MHPRKFFMILLSPADFFKIYYFKDSFRNTIRVSNSLDPDQDRQNPGPDLETVCKGHQETIKMATNKKKKMIIFLS